MAPGACGALRQLGTYVHTYVKNGGGRWEASARVKVHSFGGRWESSQTWKRMLRCARTEIHLAVYMSIFPGI